MKFKRDHAGNLMAIVTHHVNKEDYALIECEFDRITDLEEKTMESHWVSQKYLKKYLIIKLILYPFHWLLLRLFVSKNDAIYFTKLNKQFYKVIKTDIVDPDTINKYLDHVF